MDFYNLDKTFKRVYIAGGQTNGYIRNPEIDCVNQYEIKPRPRQGQEYAQEYKMREKQELEANAARGEEEDEDYYFGSRSAVSKLNQLEVTTAGTSRDINELEREKLPQLYDKYYKDHPKPENNLNINNYKKTILTMIGINEVVLITGPTGCGKTTQVPQYILDSCAEKNEYCNIAVTQPRRIAAISIARRVCEERNWELGGICGYQVGQQGMISDDTMLTYMTVGIFLSMIVSERDMNKFTHVILDEIHERDISTDFALLVVKKLLNSNSRNVKVILMSATIDPVKFSTYFQRLVLGKFEPAPVVNIQCSTQYLIQEFYLEELSSLGELPDIDYANPGISEEAMNICIKLIKQFERIDKNDKSKKSVLVFLPGIFDIETLFAKLNDPKVYNPGMSAVKYDWMVVPLHSSITQEEQKHAFRLPPKGCRKIILATNIAESSITVPDVQFVVDFCLTKVLMSDDVSNFSSLQLVWASKANCKQRAGRVGRVMEGRVYRMVYKDFYQNLADECMPDMLRCPLDKIVLQAKKLDMGEPKSILGLALDPPHLENIEQTILSLKEAGGLLLTCNRVFTPYDGDLTYLGLLMEQLPVDIRITRLIVLGYIFGVLPECIIMGAAMSLKSVFSNPFQEKMKAYDMKLDWADGTCSDCIAFLHVYEVWRRNKDEGYFERSVGGGERQWAKRHYIQIKTLHEVEILVLDITRRLKINNIETIQARGKIEWLDHEKALVLKLVIAGAFYPNYFGRGERGGQIDEKNAVKILSGKNPFTTVYLSNFPRDQPAELYSQLIKNELRECKEDMKISYDGSCKVFVEFRKPDPNLQELSSDLPYDGIISSKISMAVYRAIKIRQIRRKIDIRVLPAREAQIKASKLGIADRRDVFDPEEDKRFLRTKHFAISLPSIDVEIIQFKICHFIDPGHFWVHHDDEITMNDRRTLLQMLNGPNYERNVRRLPNPPQVGDICIAPYTEQDETFLYRCRIDAIESRNGRTQVEAFFIDYGNSALVDERDLYDFSPAIFDAIAGIPAQAFECVLKGIKPSVIKNPKGYWSDSAKKYCYRIIRDKTLYGRIYSILSGVVSLELIAQDEHNRQVSINELLIEKKFAEPIKESFLSEENHKLRTERQTLDSDQKCAYDWLQRYEPWLKKADLEPPDARECKVILSLHGPSSPLEMRIFAYARGGVSKDVRIAQDSVNSVLLDTDPQDRHERLVVAAHISQNQSNTSLILHNTTVMPNILGLATLVPFLFCPTMELRVNEAQTEFIGMVCGLGVDDEGEPMFPEHDMEINFDCEFTLDDLKYINYIRLFMSLLLLTEEGEHKPQLSVGDVINHQKKIKKYLLKLLEAPRKPKEVEYIAKQYRWNLIRTEEFEDKKISKLNERFVFRLHRYVEITSEKAEITRLKNHIADLKRIANDRSISVNQTISVECELCPRLLNSIATLRIHLETKEHKSKEEQIVEQY